MRNFVVNFVVFALLLTICLFIYQGIRHMENSHFEKTAKAEYIETEIGSPKIEDVDFFVQEVDSGKTSSYHDIFQILVEGEKIEDDVEKLNLIIQEKNIKLVKVDAKFTKGKKVRERFDRYDLYLPKKQYFELKEKKEIQLETNK